MDSFQIIFISAFTFLNVVYSQECDSRGEMGLKKCYSSDLLKNLKVNASSELLNSIGKILEKDDFKTFCESLNKKSECLGADYEENCLNTKTFEKVFGLSYGYAFSTLFMDFSFQYLCKNSYQISQKDAKCLRQINDFDQICHHSSDSGDFCDILKGSAECHKNAIIKECGNKNFAQIISETEIYALQRIALKCI